MKSNKGITITGLVIYIASFLMICGVIGVITTFFYNNSKVLSEQASSSADYDILNLYLSKEATESENKIIEVDENRLIEFSNGNKYEYDNGLLYFIKNKEKCFVLCENLSECKFTKQDDGGSFIVNLTAASGQKFNQTYYLSN